MSHSRSFIRPCAEFPNDNPLLHDGVSWVCLRVGAPLRPIARARLAPPEAYAPSVMQMPATVATVVPTPAPVASVVEMPAPVASVVEMPAPVASAVEPHEVANEVVAVAAEAQEADLDAMIAAGAEATAPPPSVFALSPEISSGEGPDTTAEERQGDVPECAANVSAVPAVVPPDEDAPEDVFGELALEFTPIKSEVRASGAPDDLELDDLDGDDEGFAFDTSEGGSDVDFTEGALDASPAESVPARATRTESAPAEPPAAVKLAKCPAEVKTATPASETAFQSFVAAVAEVAIAAGAVPAAAALPALLSGGSAESAALLEGMRRAPSSSATIFDHSAGRIRLSGAYLRTGEAWSAILRGDAGDMSACGTSTLDGWAGDILRGLGVGSDGTIDIKRELRRRGVAAFGMLLAA